MNCIVSSKAFSSERAFNNVCLEVSAFKYGFLPTLIKKLMAYKFSQFIVSY